MNIWRLPRSSVRVSIGYDNFLIDNLAAGEYNVEVSILMDVLVLLILVVKKLTLLKLNKDIMFKLK